MTEYTSKWAEICFLLSDNLRQTIAEREFESQVVRALEVLGWSEFRNEIERQPIVQLGRGGILRPDLVIRNADRKSLIVIEVKRPAENINKTYITGQLRSYMRQMKSDFGFLISGDLRIFYDGPLNVHSDPILLDRFDFDQTSELGASFVKIFCRPSLLENRHIGYVTDKLAKFNEKKEEERLIRQLTSQDTIVKVIDYLRNEFADTDDEIFAKAIQRITLNISAKVEPEITIPVTPTQTPRRIVSRRISSNPNPPEALSSHSNVKIGTIHFDSHLEIRLRHIYGVLFFLKQGLDYPSAVHQTLRLFPEVKDPETISDKCRRGFADNVEEFLFWFNTGKTLDKLQEKFGLTNHDYNIFKALLQPSN